MASTTLASVAAATAAGYILQRVDFGDQSAYPRADSAPKRKRYQTHFTKNGLGPNASRIRALGESDTSAAAADTAALAALNGQRQTIYGFDTTALNKKPDGTQYSSADS